MVCVCVSKRGKKDRDREEFYMSGHVYRDQRTNIKSRSSPSTFMQLSTDVTCIVVFFFLFTAKAFPFEPSFQSQKIFLSETTQSIALFSVIGRQHLWLKHKSILGKLRIQEERKGKTSIANQCIPMIHCQFLIFCLLYKYM